jgi:hypothetical protein
MGAAFHVAAFAQFAGLAEHHVAAILAALEAHGALPGKRTVSSRGARLPDDFKAPDDWIEWAMQDRYWQAVDARAESEIFANYWQAKSTGAAKLDWRKTWQNWVRNSHRPNGDWRPAVKQPTAERAAWLTKTIGLYERIGGRETEIGQLQAELALLDSNVVPINRFFG